MEKCITHTHTYISPLLAFGILDLFLIFILKAYLLVILSHNQCTKMFRLPYDLLLPNCVIWKIMPALLRTLLGRKHAGWISVFSYPLGRSL